MEIDVAALGKRGTGIMSCLQQAAGLKSRLLAATVLESEAFDFATRPEGAAI